MAGALARRIEPSPGPACAIGNRFRGYAPETAQPVRTQSVELNPALEAMMVAWKGYSNGPRLDKNYFMVLQIVGKLSYSAADIEKFSIALAESQETPYFSIKAGFFLSGLINASRETDFVIHTAHFNLPIDNFGYKNTKNITVEGDAGLCVGESMEGGIITINGSTGDKVGQWMKSGTIHVKGNTGSMAGYGMKGGILIVDGDADESAGCVITGGEIHLNGNYKTIDQSGRGIVFHNDRVLMDNRPWWMKP